MRGPARRSVMPTDISALEYVGKRPGSMRRKPLSRVLFAGLLGAGSTCRSRLAGLRALGLDVVELDTSGWRPPAGRWMRSFVARTFLHPSVHGMNARLLSLLAEQVALWGDTNATAPDGHDVTSLVGERDCRAGLGGSS